MSTRRRNFSNWAYWRLQHEAATDADPCPLDDLAQLEPWRARVRDRLLTMLGPEPAPVPLDLETTESVDCGTYRRDRVVFDTESTMSVPAYLLVPHDRTEPGPAVLAIHGHGPGKSRICGLLADEEHDEGAPYAHVLANDGYVVLAPDLRGFGERADWMPDEKYHCDWDLVCASMAGVVPHQRNLWDLQRAIDVLEAHPLVDGSRIGAGGLSYGATCTLFLAAIDERVRAAMVVCYLSSWRAAHRIPWNMCGSQILPGQIGALEHLDVAALIAPRALLAENGTEDMIFPVDAARETVAALRKVYAHLGAPADALVHDVFAGGHMWHGRETSSFLERCL